MTDTARPTPEQARLIGKQVAIGQYRSGVDTDEGTRMLRALLQEARHALGPDDAVTLRIEVRVLEAAARTGDGVALAEAFRDVAARAAKVLGDMHRVSYSARNLAAQWQRKAGAVDRGIASYREELRLRERRLGFGAYRTCMSRNNLVVALMDRGDPKDTIEAAELAEREIAIRVENFGEDHAFTWVAIASRANAMLSIAEDEVDVARRDALATEAERVTAGLLAQRERRFGRRNAATLRSVRAHARALILLGRCEEAVWALRRVQAVEQSSKELDPGKTSYYLAVALSGTGRVGDREAARALAAEARDKIAAHTHAESRDAVKARRLVAALD